MEQIISYLFSGIGLYLFLGVLFAIAFLWKGAKKVDESTEGAGWFFKLLLFPGIVVFWILFLNKWIKAK